MSHTFHIPVLGLGFSVDTPLKVARFGISSVVSIVDDELLERMREYHSRGRIFHPIKKDTRDHRSKRITAYLDLLHDLVEEQHCELRCQPFLPGSGISRYFEMLPPGSFASCVYHEMVRELNPQKKSFMQNKLRSLVVKGAIDVNIMSKVDKMNRHPETGEELLSDALAAVKGFAESKLNSSLTVSAGLNPRVYSYLEEFEDFYPVDGKAPEKTIVIKVSDYRSAFIQARFLAKKGLWVHEYRIESGLNCGGHAFATDGFLSGPILEEFRSQKAEMYRVLYESYESALTQKGIKPEVSPAMRISYQGGIGTSEENKFLTDYYGLDGTGWGSPFLLVPEATNVDQDTLHNLSTAEAGDFYISGSSPLGIPFNNFRKSSGETLRKQRIEQGRPGSPCTKKYLVSNTEFTDEPICTASRQYQMLKIKQLDSMAYDPQEYQKAFDEITEKTCLCDGLCTSVYLKNEMVKPREVKAVTICPGPNTAFFKGIYSLEQMISHIYGKMDLLKGVDRPNLFINELRLYVSYLKKDIENHLVKPTEKKAKQLGKFRDELLKGIEYYTGLIPRLSTTVSGIARGMEDELIRLKEAISEITLEPVME